MSAQIVLLIVLAWGVMTAGLAVLPGLIEQAVSDPWPTVLAWIVVSLAWVPVDAVLRDRVGALARFSITAPLWIAAVVCGYWLRGLLGLP